jgi:hypothetical protein
MWAWCLSLTCSIAKSNNALEWNSIGLGASLFMIERLRIKSEFVTCRVRTIIQRNFYFIRKAISWKFQWYWATLLMNTSNSKYHHSKNVPCFGHCQVQRNYSLCMINSSTNYSLYQMLSSDHLSRFASTYCKDQPVIIVDQLIVFFLWNRCFKSTMLDIVIVESKKCIANTWQVNERSTIHSFIIDFSLFHRFDSSDANSDAM